VAGCQSVKNSGSNPDQDSGHIAASLHLNCITFSGGSRPGV